MEKTKMRPHNKRRRGKGYCCELEHGPYKQFEKKRKKSLRHGERQLDKEEIVKLLKDMVPEPKKSEFRSMSAKFGECPLCHDTGVINVYGGPDRKCNCKERYK